MSNNCLHTWPCVKGKASNGLSRKLSNSRGTAFQTCPKGIATVIAIIVIGIGIVIRIVLVIGIVGVLAIVIVEW